MGPWPPLAKKKNNNNRGKPVIAAKTVLLYRFVPRTSDWNSTGRKFNWPCWHQPRYKILDRHHCHFRASILHQQKWHNSQKKKVNWREQCCLSCCSFSRQSENHTQTGFSIHHQTKRRVVFLDLPQAIFIEKNGAIISLVVIPSTFVIRARLKFAWLISLEFYSNDTKKLMQMISLILRD